MADQYFIVCEKGHFTQEIVLDDVETPLTYLIGDQYAFRPRITVAWCFTCNRVVQAESLPPLGAIEDGLYERFVSGDRELSVWLEQRVWDKREGKSLDRRASLEVKFKWRAARKSPPRCLEGGSTSIDFGTKLSDGHHFFLHPDCRGQCQVNKVIDALEIYSGERYWYLSAEGEHLTTLLERHWTRLIHDSDRPDDKLIALMTRLQLAKTVGEFSTSHRGILGKRIFLILITSLPHEYGVYIWIPGLPEAHHYYDQVKNQNPNIELLHVGENAFFAPEVLEKSLALMQYQDMLVNIIKMKSKSVPRHSELLPTILVRHQILDIFGDILGLLIGGKAS